MPLKKKKGAIALGPIVTNSEKGAYVFYYNLENGSIDTVVRNLTVAEAKEMIAKEVENGWEDISL